jgi:hypothetical protein
MAGKERRAYWQPKPRQKIDAPIIAPGIDIPGNEWVFQIGHPSGHALATIRPIGKDIEAADLDPVGAPRCL